MRTNLYDFDSALQNGQKAIENLCVKIKGYETVHDPVYAYVVDGFNKAYSQPRLSTKKARYFLVKIFNEIVKPYETAITRSEIRTTRRSIYNHIPYKDYVTASLSKVICGIHYVGSDNNNYIVYFIDNLFASSRRGVPLIVLVRSLISVIAHERAHFAFKDSEKETDPLIAEARADDIALRVLKDFHERDLNFDFDNTKEIEDFIRTSIRDDWTEDSVIKQ